MLFGDQFGKYFGWFDGFNVSTVDVKIINGRYSPCTICRWWTQCIIPKRGLVNRTRSYGPDIKTVFRCVEFTIKDNPNSRGY